MGKASDDLEPQNLSRDLDDDDSASTIAASVASNETIKAKNESEVDKPSDDDDDDETQTVQGEDDRADWIKTSKGDVDDAFDLSSEQLGESSSAATNRRGFAALSGTMDRVRDSINKTSKQAGEKLEKDGRGLLSIVKKLYRKPNNVLPV